MTPVEIRNEKLGATVVEALKKRYFDAYYVNTAAEAKELALSLIPQGDTVTWGGTMTANEIGLIDALKSGNYNCIDRENAEDRQKAMREAFFADTYIMSANAISEDGQLVNIDGNGNRVAAMIFGPKSVIVIAGVNKIAKTAEDALTRARTVAAPINAQRFDIVTGCKVGGRCTDCKSEQTVCVHMVITRVSRPAGRIKVILVGENLGY